MLALLCSVHYLDKTPYQDSHIAYHFPPNAMPYFKPTSPQENHKTRFEPNTLQIICIHHQNTALKTIQQLQPLHTILANLNLPILHTMEIPPTPSNTNINKSPKWNNTPNPTPIPSNSNMTPPLPTYDEAIQLQFLQQYSYYIDRLCFPPLQISPKSWRA